jgi:hypothetical protein
MSLKKHVCKICQKPFLCAEGKNRFRIEGVVVYLCDDHLQDAKTVLDRIEMEPLRPPYAHTGLTPRQRGKLGKTES